MKNIMKNLAAVLAGVLVPGVAIASVSRIGTVEYVLSTARPDSSMVMCGAEEVVGSELAFVNLGKALFAELRYYLWQVKEEEEARWNRLGMRLLMRDSGTRLLPQPRVGARTDGSEEDAHEEVQAAAPEFVDVEAPEVGADLRTSLLVTLQEEGRELRGGDQDHEVAEIMDFVRGEAHAATWSGESVSLDTRIRRVLGEWLRLTETTTNMGIGALQEAVGNVVYAAEYVVEMTLSGTRAAELNFGALVFCVLDSVEIEDAQRARVRLDIHYIPTGEIFPFWLANGLSLIERQRVLLRMVHRFADEVCVARQDSLVELLSDAEEGVEEVTDDGSVARQVARELMRASVIVLTDKTALRLAVEREIMQMQRDQRGEEEEQPVLYPFVRGGDNELRMDGLLRFVLEREEFGIPVVPAPLIDVAVRRIMP